MTHEEIQQVLDFAEKYDIESNGSNLYNIYCGLHSGLPDCCIVHYIKYWLRGYSPEMNQEEFKKYHFDLMNFRPRPHYIICKKCMQLNNIVKLKDCNCSDTQPWEFWKDYAACYESILCDETAERMTKKNNL